MNIFVLQLNYDVIASVLLIFTKGNSVSIMVHVALIVWALVILIFIGRTLRSAYRKKLSSLFADLGLTLIFSFSLLIFASVGTTRFATFTTGSVIVTVGLWVVLAIGCASLVFAPFVESLVRAVQAAGVRHREGRTKRLDKKKAAEAETRKGVKEKIDRATLPTTGIVRPSETDSE